MKYAENAEIERGVDGMLVIVDEFAVLVDYGFEKYSAEFEVSLTVYHCGEWPTVRPVLSISSSCS